MAEAIGRTQPAGEVPMAAVDAEVLTFEQDLFHSGSVAPKLRRLKGRMV